MIIKVKTIIFFSDDSKYAIFKAVTQKQNKAGKYVDTKDINTYTGKFMAIFPNDKLDVECRKQETKQYGTQYAITQYKRIMPGTADEVKLYLKHIKGVGPTTINTIVDAYGTDTLPTIRNNAQKLKDLGIKPSIIEKLSETVKESEEFEEIMGFLLLHNIDHRYALEIHRKYITSAVAKMVDNPYSPYMDDIFDFWTADSLAFSLGKVYNDPIRVTAAVLAYLRWDSESRGNVYSDGYYCLPAFLKKSPYKEELQQADISAAQQELNKQGKIIIYDGGIYLKNLFYAERGIAQHFLRLQNGLKDYVYETQDIDDFIFDYENENNILINEGQQNAIKTALTQPVSILTGGPGTGKSRTLAAIIAAIRKLSPRADIRICAPTGKAAQRISEFTGLQAKTIHSLLRLSPENPAVYEGQLECDFLLVDEFSMVDVSLCDLLFRALNNKSRIIIVGDYEQLPSVGPGLVLRDFINSGLIPVTRLTTIYRQNGDSNIIRNAHAIINQEKDKPIDLSINNEKGGDFYLLDAPTPQNIAKSIVKSVHHLIDDMGYTMDDIKVLSPIHGSDIGTERLNVVMQDEFNESQDTYQCGENKEFRVGDPVIHTRNNYDIEVFNGETGTVVGFGHSKEKRVKVAYPNKDVWYDWQAVADLELAYSITTHKSQGSEFKVVILPIHELFLNSLSKNLIYTAITRAKQMVIIVGSEEVLRAGIRKTNDTNRHSKLIKRMQQAVG